MIKDFNSKTELLTIKKVPTFRMVALSFFSISLIIFTCSYHIEAKTNTESQTYKNLMGVGINSSREYLNCKDWVQKAPVVGSVEEYRQVLTDGWRTLNFIVCAQEHFPNNILDEELVRIKLEAIRGQIRQLKKDFSDRSFTITFKGYDKLPARWADGTKITELYDRIRKSKQMEKQYLKWWKLASEIFKDEKTVVFWPMNEPDYRLEGGLEYHLKLSTKVIDEIRNVNPQRWIILNGYSHSLVGRGRSIFKIMKPIDRENIVYGFHVYGTNKSKYNLPDFYEKNVISDISQWDKKTKDALNEITKFKKNFNVPVMVSEVGIVAKSKYIKRGVESEERARFFKEVISPWSIKCKCGFFYWALGADNTPYVRLRAKDKGATEYSGVSKGFDPRPFSKPLIRDELLFKAIGLNDYFVFKKTKVKELQKLLNSDGYDVGDVDGILGNKTQEAVRAWYKKKKIRFNKKTSDKLEYLIALENIKNSK